MTPKKVFAIVLNYNSKDMIRQCLQSLLVSDYPNLEVVVVDNDSKDGSFELAKTAFSKFKFIKNSKNIGFGAGNNVAIRFALERMADYVFLLNSDATVAENTISELVAALEKQEKAGLASPMIYAEDGKTVWFSGGQINWLAMKAVHVPNLAPEEIDYLSGCALLIKKEVFKEIGLFDEDYFLYYEDVDLCWRAKNAGFAMVVVPSVAAIHLEKSELQKNEKTYWLVLSGILFFKKNASPLLKTWINFYLFLRKLKNKKDLASRENYLAKDVARAYQDSKK